MGPFVSESREQKQGQRLWCKAGASGGGLTDFGFGVLRGLDAQREAALALGDRNPVGHHVTNVILSEQAPGRVHARSKGISVSADGGCGSVTYDDILVLGEQGWRISERIVRARRVPLGG